MGHSVTVKNLQCRVRQPPSYRNAEIDRTSIPEATQLPLMTPFSLRVLRARHPFLLYIPLNPPSPRPAHRLSPRSPPSPPFATHSKVVQRQMTHLRFLRWITLPCHSIAQTHHWGTHHRHYAEDRRTQAHPILDHLHLVPARVNSRTARRVPGDMYLAALDTHILVLSSTAQTPEATTGMALTFRHPRLPSPPCQTCSRDSHKVKVQRRQNQKRIRWRWTPVPQQSTPSTLCSYVLLRQQSTRSGGSSNSLL